MEFFNVCTRTKNGIVEIYPDFKVGVTRDFMVRGKAFYAVWDEARGLWSTDEYDVARLVDAELAQTLETLKGQMPDGRYSVKWMSASQTGSWRTYKNHVSNLPDHFTPLDQRFVFRSDDPRYEDYASRRLPYDLERKEPAAWEEIVGTLYSEEERRKIEWMIGAILTGEAKSIQKFLVFYGDPGTGKSTILQIIAKLTEGYNVPFEAGSLGRAANQFATEVFRTAPLVAIDHDGDLSRIEDNTRLNSIVSHETMSINEKHKSTYPLTLRTMLLIGTNTPVRITDSKSGLMRRLIDVGPTGNRLPVARYDQLMAGIDFELGAIANHCVEVFRQLGKNFYNGYVPITMIRNTNSFYDFVEENWDVFKSSEYVTLTQVYSMYKEYVKDANVPFPLTRQKVRLELQSYFSEFKERIVLPDGSKPRNVYLGFRSDKFETVEEQSGHIPLVLDSKESLLDAMLAQFPAQYSTDAGTPAKGWDSVTETLQSLDTGKEHYVRPPENHIVIDFDLKDSTGVKSRELNLTAASLWPPTYAEYSKGGAGVHLHYIYDGSDLDELSSLYSEGIEVKVFRGKASLRRRLSLCNQTEVAHISEGLPLKERKKVLTETQLKSERGLRELIERNLRKEIHPNTKPSVDFIEKVLTEAYEQGMVYDVTDLRPRLIKFALGATNQSQACLKIVMALPYVGKANEEAREVVLDDDKPLTFFDLEVYPNLFVVSYKQAGATDTTDLVNPTSQQIEPLMKQKLVGFNNRRYDNHILYARFLGYDNAALYKLSKQLISNDRSATFAEAYGLSYADIYDYSSKKQSLKRFQIELGLNHKEMGISWDEPVPEELIPEVVAYCSNDVKTTEQVHEARRGDFVARQILAQMSGLSVNDTTAKHTAKIIFKSDKDAASKFVYTDLSKQFPGYKYEFGKSTYRGEEVSEGGLVRAAPGIYTNVKVFDVAAMHPTSIEQLNLFGPYTENYNNLRKARLAIKHGEYEKVNEILGVDVSAYTGTKEDADSLNYALKIVINIVYGLTSAKFDNPFRDIRNVDNIVAKRGALFMMDLRAHLESLGVDVIHIKTDSIKICDPTPEIEAEIYEFGAKYGYEFEVEDVFEKFCLVNDAVYIAKDFEGKWHATGAQFAEPVVFKTLFSGEKIEFDDYVQTKTVNGALYLVDGERKTFVGRAGAFVPVKEGYDLIREADGRSGFATGAKGFKWREAEAVRLTDGIDAIDLSYYRQLVDKAREAIGQFGDPEAFCA